MDVSIYRNEEDQTIIEMIYIDGELPKKSEMSKVKSIKYLSIKNISDSTELKEFLSRIPINTVERLEIISCNLEEVPLEIFEQLQSVIHIDIERSQGVNYNEILRIIPNKEQVEALLLWGREQDKDDLVPQLLETYTNVEVIALRNFTEINMEELHSALVKAQRLQQFIIKGNIRSLDFISGIELDHITIMDNNLDLSLITPEIARFHKNIYFTTEKGNIITDRTEDGQGYELGISSDYSKDIEILRKLIDGAVRAEIYGTQISVSNIDEIKTIIKNKDILKRLGSLTIKLQHIGVISPEQLEETRRELDIDMIRIMDPDYDDNEQALQYSIGEYETLYSKVQEIVGDIPSDLTDLQKFMIVYNRLGSRIVYDNELVRDDEDRDKEYIEENRYTGRNLINGLIKGKCVCAGYADILYNCLKSIGIDVCKIGSEDHVWNKVQIDGVWYNVDLTWDCKSIVKPKLEGLKHCLRGDEEFKNGHLQNSGRKIDCNIDYPRKEIVKALEFAQAFERGEIAKDAEYEQIIGGLSFVHILKDKVMTLLGKRKKIEESKDITKVPTTEDRRKQWLTKQGIVLDNGAELSRTDTETTKPKTPVKDKEINDD